MRSVDHFLAALVAYYLHRLPDFRGKWRLLRPLDGVLSGVPVPSRYVGVKLALDVADRTNQLCVLGRYDDVVPDEVSRLEEGDCLVDVGANCGLFTIMAGHRVGRSGLVVAFEPCLATYARLTSNLSLNRLGNVLPLNMAVAERFDQMKLDISAPGHTGRYSIATEESTEIAEITAINLKDFPGICALLGKRPTLIKIDVEGYELHALRGLTPLLERPETRRLVVEIDGRNLARYGSTPNDIYAILGKFGFAPTTTRSRGAHYDEVFVRAGDSGQALASGKRIAKAQRGHIAFVLPGLGAGGAERVVSIIANALVERGWQITVITFAERDALSFYPYPDAVDLIRLDIPTQPQRWWRALPMSFTRTWRLRRALRGIAPHVVISFLTRTNVLALLASVDSDVPVIVSERNNPEQQDFGRVWHALRSRLYRRAFGLVTMTQGAMDYFPRAMRQRQWVIPNPVLPVEHRAARARGMLNLTAVGRLVPQKGFDLLLRAYAQIVHAFPDWELVIWGDGPERETLEQLAQSLGIGDHVRFPGLSSVPGGWLFSTDLFVLSSRYEGWGNVLHEAMASGIASVAFDCPWGPAEMIDDGVNGILVPPGDIAALAAALVDLMGDPQRRDVLGKAARQSAARFATDAIVTRWEAAATEAMTGGRSVGEQDLVHDSHFGR